MKEEGRAYGKKIRGDNEENSRGGKSYSGDCSGTIERVRSLRLK